ncbi:MAG: EcsC family protein [Coleofasciculus sp. S288]|nr:EcsC family protein [Coleofasciculus sp. S288]
MVERSTERLFTDQMSEAIATAARIANCAAKTASGAVQVAADNVTGTTAYVGKSVGPATMRFVEDGTETIGKIVTPIAENPLIKYASKVPGINVLLTALGQVDVEKAQQEVDKLRQEHPLESTEQLAHRIVVDAAMKAGGIGLLTNFVPPFALALFGVELAAVTAIQAEMIYRIAAAYGFPLKDPTRRGEVLAIFGLSVGSSGVLKGGLSFVELLPLIGAAVGASSNTALIYSIGAVASRFYEAKKNSNVQLV